MKEQGYEVTELHEKLYAMTALVNAVSLTLDTQHVRKATKTILQIVSYWRIS